MYFLRIILAASLNFIYFNGSAQLLDSLQNHLTHKPKFFIKLDSRNSFVASRSARITGIKLGYDYNNSLRFGIGANWLNKAVIKPRLLTNGNGELYTVRAALKIFYLSPFSEYVFFRNKRWEHTINLQLGFGKSWVNYKDYRGVKFTENQKFILLYEPSMITQYKVLPWLGIGCGVGYRLLLLNNKSSGANFNSPVYVLKSRLFFDELYHILLKKRQQVQG